MSTHILSHIFIIVTVQVATVYILHRCNSMTCIWVQYTAIATQWRADSLQNVAPAS